MEANSQTDNVIIYKKPNKKRLKGAKNSEKKISVNNKYMKHFEEIKNKILIKNKIDIYIYTLKLLKNKTMSNSKKMMMTQNTAREYFNTSKTARAVPIYLEVVGKHKNPALDDGTWGTGKKNVCADKIWKEENKEINDKRIETYLTEKGMECNYLAVQTTKFIQLDLDWRGSLKDMKKNKFLWKIVKKCDELFDNNKSATKECGKHYICPLPTGKTLNLNFLDFSEYSSKEFLRPELFTGKEADMEILCGKWAWCDKNAVINKAGNGKTPTGKDTKKILQMLFKQKYHYGYVEPEPVKTEPVETEPVEPVDNIIMEELEEPVDNDSLYENTMKKTIQPVNYDEVREYIKNIKQSYIDSDKDFHIIMCACSNTEHKNELKATLKEVGSKSHKAGNGNKSYDDWFEYSWERSIVRHTSIGTIYNYSKTSNVKTHYQTLHKYNDPSEMYDSQEFAEIFLKNNKSSILVQKNINDPQQPKEIYWFNHKTNMWELDDKFCVMKNTIGNDMKFHLWCECNKLQTLVKSLKAELNKLIEEDPKSSQIEAIERAIKSGEDKFKIVHKKYLSTGEPTFRSNVMTILEQELKSLHTEYKEFDAEPFILSFENGSYDLINNEVKPISREDYLTKILSYELREPDVENYKTFMEFFNSTMKYDDVKQDLKYILATCLAGITPQKLFMLNGAGRNGKSVLQKIMSKMLSGYSYEGAGTVLSTVITPSKASPELGNLNKKRVAFYSEPDEHKPMSQSTVKTLTGDGKVQARMCYSNNCETIIEATHILICNKIPDIDGEIDTAIIERLVKIDFPYRFTADGDKQPENDIYKYPNKLYDDKKWLEEAKYSMLKMCLEFIKEYPEKIGNGVSIWDDKYKFCERTKTSSSKFCENIDIVREWLVSNVVELTEAEIKANGKAEYLSTIQQGTDWGTSLWDIFNSSEAFNKLKKMKKEINKTEFRGRCSVLFSNHFVKKKDNSRNLLKNMRLRTDDELEELDQQKNGIGGLVENTEPENEIIDIENDIDEPIDELLSDTENTISDSDSD
tara:strand:- start:4180 stop:7269 length:3090 start_codon:yes stop_codon:yes gene_type:complete